MTAQPWMKFYPTNWRGDPALRVCSMAARGLWMEMICLMHEATPRGDLRVNGKPLSERQLASLAGVSLDELTSLLEELSDAGVFSRDGDVIFSRRMRREAEKSEEGKRNGRLGGNPNIKGRDNPSPTQGVNPQPNTYWHVASSDLTSKETSKKNEYDKLEAELREAAGLEQDPSPGLLVLKPIYDLLDAGFELHKDILPVIRECKARGNSGQSWAYYAAAVQRRQEKASSVARKPETKVVGAVEWITVDDHRWFPLAQRYRETNGGKDPPKRGGQGGLGYHFRKAWVNEAIDVRKSA